ncbi:hypothetical protein MW371_005371 [Pseudomonas aeruginosa]|nr:hypothetical protein [Pseudomonas aeruginosa]
MTTSKIQMDQIRPTSATVTGENILAGSQKKSSLSPAEGLQGASPDATCTCPSGDGSLRHPCPARPAVEQAEAERPEMSSERAAYFMRRFKAEEKMLGPNEQAAVDYVLSLIAQHERIVGALRAELETERMRLAGCGVAALGYFDGCADAYKSASLSDVLRLRADCDAALARVASLESKLAELEKPKPAAPALAALPPFAEKVLAKLHRFYDCVSDFESGGVDIGRHWLDLLTQLGLLNRVQRSPALWEITQQGEDLLGTSQPSPAPELAERGTQHRFSTTEQTCRHDFAGVWWNDNGETKTGRECRHCGFFVADVTKAQAEQEAERPEVVARVVHSNPVVLDQCAQLNANDEMMTVAQHSASVARWAEMFNRVEQERDAALARVAELEAALSSALSQHGVKFMDPPDGGDTPLIEQVCRMSQALAELEKQESVAWVEVIDRDYGPYKFYGKRLLPKGKHQLYAAPVAQAQHSVPEEFIGRLSEFLAQRGATGKALLRELRTVLAAVGDK